MWSPCGGRPPVGLVALIVLIALIPATAPATSGVVDGQWTPWSLLTSPCSATCGGGVSLRIRTCTDPAPQGNGLPCQNISNLPAEIETRNFPCNEESCWSYDPIWMPWSACSEMCGIGNRTRQPNCTGNAGCGATVPPPEIEECNTWNKSECPNPCTKVTCTDYAGCIDISDDIQPKTKCSCVMGYEMQPNGKCVQPEPTTPTPRPIPTMPAEQKVVATVISKTASSVLIFFVTITLILFLFLRVFTTDRVIQMNMEIALLTAHLCLMLPTSLTDQVILCKIVSILLHFFILACFMFMMLEAVHMYTMVAYVVKKDGMFNKLQNILIGWGVSAGIVGISVAFEWANYGGEYHCWMQMDTGVMPAQQLPVIVIMIMTFTLIEAAGAAEYKPLKGMDYKQLLSAKFSQRTNLIICPLVYAHWLLGTLSEYQQNIGLYSVFSIMNGWLGACVFFFHCSNNQQVREKLASGVGSLRGN